MQRSKTTLLTPGDCKKTNTPKAGKIFKKRFFENLKKAKLIDPGERILLAVSGGSDSVAMAHLMEDHTVRPGVAYIDHMLRQGTAAEKDFVNSVARRLRMPFYSKRADVGKIAKRTKKSIEDAGREQRYRLLAGICRTHNYTKILTAHTLSDRIETIFIKILRGGGLTSFYGIKSRMNIFGTFVVRPMLDFSRQQLRNFLRAEKIKFIDDPSNMDQQFLRNKVRHSLLPVLKKDFGENYEKRMLALSRQAEDLNNFIESEYHEFRGIRDGKLDSGMYMKYNKFLRKCFLAEFLDKKVNSEYINRIDSFISSGKGGSFTLKGMELRIKKGIGIKKGVK